MYPLLGEIAVMCYHQYVEVDRFYIQPFANVMGSRKAGLLKQSCTKFVVLGARVLAHNFLFINMHVFTRDTRLVTHLSHSRFLVFYSHALTWLATIGLRARRTHVFFNESNARCFLLFHHGAASLERGFGRVLS